MLFGGLVLHVFKKLSEKVSAQKSFFFLQLCPEKSVKCTIYDVKVPFYYFLLLHPVGTYQKIVKRPKRKNPSEVVFQKLESQCSLNI